MPIPQGTPSSKPIDFDMACRVVGRLFLESQAELQRQAESTADTVQSLREQLQEEQKKSANFQRSAAALEQELANLKKLPVPER